MLRLASALSNGLLASLVAFGCTRGRDLGVTTGTGAGTGNLGIVAQPYSPPNFVPIGWCCKKDFKLKILRYPVE